MRQKARYDVTYHLRMSAESAERRAHDDSLCVFWDGTASHIRYLGAVYRDESARGIVRGKPEEIVDRLGPGRREGFCCALQHFMVDHARRRECRRDGGKEDECAA